MKFDSWKLIINVLIWVWFVLGICTHPIWGGKKYKANFDGLNIFRSNNYEIEKLCYQFDKWITHSFYHYFLIALQK
jgi:hypothetical protein